MGIFNFNPSDLLSFYLTFFRISVVLFMMPFFGGKSVPTRVKAMVCVVVTLAVWPSVGLDGNLMPANIFDIAIMFIGELILGLVLSFSISVLFAAVQTGGSFVGMQMGFSMVNIIDPLSGTNESVVAHFLYMCTILIFINLNGHLYILSGVIDSFKIIPPGEIYLSPTLNRQMIDISKLIFELAIRIAAPVLAAIFVVDLALALISKMAPQMNVLMLGFPLKIMIGFFFLSMVFALLGNYVQEFISNMPNLFTNILRAGAPNALP